MKHYVWFHPNYISHQETASEAKGQQANFIAYHYTILSDHELHKIRPADHLTIIGAPEVPTDDEERKEQMADNIGGDNAAQCIARLVKLGLQLAPKVLTLELHHAGTPGGFAQELSKNSLFKYSVIEANVGIVGRNTKPRSWSFPTDSLGRSIQTHCSNWHFYLSGYHIGTYKHKSYQLEDVIEELSPKGFHDSFFSNYKPGCRGGRVGRYCANDNKITLEQALFFVNEKRASATTDAVDLTLKNVYQPK